jgi:drug/metabolite transporter (DMT)-like permease
MQIRKWLNLPAIGAVVIWGVVPTATKFALRDFDPAGLVVLRLIITSLLLFLMLAIAEKKIGINKEDLPLLCLAGVVGAGLFQFLFAVGVDHTTASNAAVIMAMAPIFTALVAAGLRQEPFRLLTILGILTAFGGVTLLVQGRELTVRMENLVGDLVVLAAAFTWALYPVAAAPILRRHSVLKTTTYATALAAVAVFPFTIGDLLQQNWAAVTPEGWGGAFYFILFGGLIAWWLWGRGISQIGPTQTMVFYYIQPLVGVTVAILLLAERLSLVQASGVALVFLGVGLARRW